MFTLGPQAKWLDEEEKHPFGCLSGTVATLGDFEVSETGWMMFKTLGMNQRGSGMDHKTMIALHWWKIREHLDCELWWWWLEQRMQDSLSLSLSLKSKRRVLNDLPAWLGEWVSAVGNFFGYRIRLAKKTTDMAEISVLCFSGGGKFWPMHAKTILV